MTGRIQNETQDRKKRSDWIALFLVLFPCLLFEGTASLPPELSTSGVNDDQFISRDFSCECLWHLRTQI